MTKKLMIPPAVVVACLLGYAFYRMFSGPQMEVQEHIRTFETVMPVTPPNSVPLEPEYPAMPSPQAAHMLKNPLQPSKDNLKKGAAYYRYYCLFCHGRFGDGYGPVGQSYIPVPTDLRSDEVLSMTDGELMLAMLKGQGHEPVLERVIPERQRWYLVLYVKNVFR